MVRNFGEVLGIERPTFFTKLLAAIERDATTAGRDHVKDFNWKLFDQVVPLYTEKAADELRTKANRSSLWKGHRGRRRLADCARRSSHAVRQASIPLAKVQTDLQKEMDTVCQVPGWGNIWTQPIINRVDMLATGVRTMIGVKVFGDDLNKIQKVSEEIADVLQASSRRRRRRFPTRVVGEGYLEITIDRDRAARYGVNVGDIQDVIETALGGKTITTTVEGRERFPVRIRYARAFREDEESVKNLLISHRRQDGRQAAMAGEHAAASPRLQQRSADVVGRRRRRPAPTSTSIRIGGMTQIPLSQVADVQIVEGPSMIKSENGMLRTYVQLNVRDRDIVGFVEEAQRAVAEKVKLPHRHVPRMERPVRASGPRQNARSRSSCRSSSLIIFVILYLTYNDFADAVLMMMAVPGAVVGGVFFQCAVRFQLQRRRVGRLHRLLRHGHGDGRRDARLSPRSARRTRRTREHRLARRTQARHHRRSRPPLAAQAAHRRHDHHRPRAHALGDRHRRRNHATDGRPRAGRPAGRRRSHRHLPSRPLLPRPRRRWRKLHEQQTANVEERELPRPVAAISAISS